MACVHREILLNVSAERAWEALRDTGNAHRIFSGVLVDSWLDGDMRTVTFANGRSVRERIVNIDDARRRVAYSVLDEPFTHHNASMQIIPESAVTCRFVWTSDFLPDSLTDNVAPLVDAGINALKRNFEQSTSPAPP